MNSNNSAFTRKWPQSLILDRQLLLTCHLCLGHISAVFCALHAAWPINTPHNFTSVNTGFFYIVPHDELLLNFFTLSRKGKPPVPGNSKDRADYLLALFQEKRRGHVFRRRGVSRCACMRLLTGRSGWTEKAGPYGFTHWKQPPVTFLHTHTYTLTGKHTHTHTGTDRGSPPARETPPPPPHSSAQDRTPHSHTLFGYLSLHFNAWVNRPSSTTFG